MRLGLASALVVLLGVAQAVLNNNGQDYEIEDNRDEWDGPDGYKITIYSNIDNSPYDGATPYVFVTQEDDADDQAVDMTATNIKAGVGSFRGCAFAAGQIIGDETVLTFNAGCELEGNRFYSFFLAFEKADESEIDFLKATSDTTPYRVYLPGSLGETCSLKTTDMTAVVINDDVVRFGWKNPEPVATAAQFFTTFEASLHPAATLEQPNPFNAETIFTITGSSTPTEFQSIDFSVSEINDARFANDVRLGFVFYVTIKRNNPVPGLINTCFPSDSYFPLDNQIILWVPPEAPSDLLLTTTSASSVKLEWGAADTSAELGGAGVVLASYHVEADTSADFSSNAVKELTIDAGATETAINSLQSGENWYFRVRAVTTLPSPRYAEKTEDSYGLWPALSLEVLPLTYKPDPPTDVTLLPSAPTAMTLTWTKPVEDGGTNVLSYNLYLSESSVDLDLATPVVVLANTGVTTYVFASQTPDRTYHARVEAVNDNSGGPGGSTSVGSDSGDFLFVYYASNDLNVVAESLSSTRLRVSWTYPSDNGGMDVQTFKIRRCETGAVNCQVNNIPYDGTTTTLDMDALAGTNFEFEVSSFNGYKEAGADVWSQTANATLLHVFTPGVVDWDADEIKVINATSIHLAWSLADDGGEAVTKYLITVQPARATSFTVVYEDGCCNTNGDEEFTVTGLPARTAGNDDTYTFHAQAFNGVNSAANSTGYAPLGPQSPATVLKFIPSAVATEQLTKQPTKQPTTKQPTKQPTTSATTTTTLAPTTATLAPTTATLAPTAAAEPCVCKDSWTSPEDGATCAQEHTGCAVDDDGLSCDGWAELWCIVANPGCATDESWNSVGWTYCTAAPTSAATEAPTNKPTVAPTTSAPTPSPFEGPTNTPTATPTGTPTMTTSAPTTTTSAPTTTTLAPTTTTLAPTTAILTPTTTTLAPTPTALTPATTTSAPTEASTNTSSATPTGTPTMTTSAPTTTTSAPTTTTLAPTTTTLAPTTATLTPTTTTLAPTPTALTPATTTLAPAEASINTPTAAPTPAPTGAPTYKTTAAPAGIPTATTATIDTTDTIDSSISTKAKSPSASPTMTPTSARVVSDPLVNIMEEAEETLSSSLTLGLSLGLSAAVMAGIIAFVCWKRAQGKGGADRVTPISRRGSIFARMKGLPVPNINEPKDSHRDEPVGRESRLSRAATRSYVADRVQEKLEVDLEGGGERDGGAAGKWGRMVGAGGQEAEIMEIAGVGEGAEHEPAEHR